MSEAMGAAQFQETSSAENVGAEVLDEESTMHVKRQATSNEEVQYYQGEKKYMYFNQNIQNFRKIIYSFEVTYKTVSDV